jgi:hypothetical protein
MSKIAMFEFKCRRCGAVESRGVTSEQNGLPLLSGLITGDDSFAKKMFGPALMEKDLHNCKDGGMGISDLLGFRVDADK